MLPNHPCAGFVSIPRILLPLCRKTELGFGLTSFTVEFADGRLRIERDPENFTLVTLKDQRVAYKVQLLGSIVLEEETTGSVGWHDFFRIEWEDDAAAPELVFDKPPTRIVRTYEKGQAIELGVEPAGQYEVTYDDGVGALFSRRGDGKGFDFSFSTGFHGSFWKEEDDSWMMKFKGNRLSWEDDGKDAQSKFLVSRSKFTDNLMLYFWHGAKVTLR
jgi:hypothetical protein